MWFLVESVSVRNGAGLGITCGEEDGGGFRAHLLADGQLMRGVLLWSVRGTKENASGAVIAIFNLPNRGGLTFGKRVLHSQPFHHLISLPLCVPTARKMDEENRSDTCRDRKKRERDALFSGEAIRRVVGRAKTARPRKAKSHRRRFCSPPSLSPVFGRAVHGIIGW